MKNSQKFTMFLTAVCLSCSVENKRALFALQLDVLFFFLFFFLSKVCAKKCIRVSNKVHFCSYFDCTVCGPTYPKIDEII